jgi:D-serine deaminase-like pyridoxal phosphate-dependent protein
MDADYGRNPDRDGAPTKAFEPNLFVWATVISRRRTARSSKPASSRWPSIPARRSFATSPPPPYERASDEHGRLGIAGATNRLNIGDRVRLIPDHRDPTVNLSSASAANASSRFGQVGQKGGLGVLTAIRRLATSY